MNSRKASTVTESRSIWIPRVWVVSTVLVLVLVLELQEIIYSLDRTASVISQSRTSAVKEAMTFLTHVLHNSSLDSSECSTLHSLGC